MTARPTLRRMLVAALTVAVVLSGGAVAAADDGDGDGAAGTLQDLPLTVWVMNPRASYVQPYTWELVNAVDTADARAVPGAGHESTWTITVTASQGEPTDVEVSAELNVYNPADRERDLRGAVFTLAGVEGTPAGELHAALPSGSVVLVSVTWSLPVLPARSDAVTMTLDGQAVEVGGIGWWTTVRDTVDETAFLDASFPEFGWDPTNIGDLLVLDAADHLQGAQYTYQARRGGRLAPGECAAYANTATLYAEGNTLAEDSASVTVCTGQDLTVVTTAYGTAQRTYAWDLTKEIVGPAQATTGADGQAAFDYRVTAVPLSYRDAGWKFTGGALVHNPNAWEVVVDVVGEPMLGAGATVTCPSIADGSYLIPAGHWVYPAYECDVQGEPDLTGGTQMFTVTWDPAVAYSPGSKASATEDFDFAPAPTNETVTVVDGGGDPAGDPAAAPTVLGTAVWADGAPTVFEYRMPANGPAWPDTAVTHTTAAWLSELPEVRDDATVTVTSSPLTATVRTDASYTVEYGWTIDEYLTSGNAEARARPGVGAELGYGVTVTAERAEREFLATAAVSLTNPNPFDVPLTGFTVEVNGAVVDPRTVTADADVIGPGGTATLTFPLHDGDERPGELTVTVTNAVGDVASAVVDFDDVVPVEVNRYADLTNTFAEYGPDPAAATDRVTLDAVALIDGTQSGEYRFTAVRGADVAPGQCGAYDAAAILTPDAADVLTDVVPVRVCTGADLTVEASAVTSLVRAYAWDVAKEVVGAPTVTVGANGTATVDYAVTVTPRPFTDAGWRLSGEVTVTNPNTWDVDVTVVDVPGLGDDVACTVGGGAATTVAAGGAAVLPYGCTFTGTPDLDGTATALIAWDGDQAASPGDSARYDIDLAAADRDVTPVDRTVTVFDDAATPGGTPMVLGTATWNPDGTAATFAYSLTLAGPAADDAVTYRNTAWIDGPAAAASADVTVTREPPGPGALTGGPGVLTGGFALGGSPWWAVLLLGAAGLVLFGSAPRTSRFAPGNHRPTPCEHGTRQSALRHCPRPRRFGE